MKKKLFTFVDELFILFTFVSYPLLNSHSFLKINLLAMNQETKKTLLRLLWQLLSALLAAFGGVTAASAALSVGLI